jgi:hypothetical protein
MINYFLIGGDVPFDSDTLLVNDFMNLNIKSVQSFGCVHVGRMCMHISIKISAHTYKYLRLYCISKKI